MQILFLMADGFEETEFVTPFDYLQRAGFEVALASVSGDSSVTGAHGLKIAADFALSGVDTAKFDAVLLPGGGPGVQRLKASADVERVVCDFNDQNKWIFAICAAPLVLSKAGLLVDRTATCFPAARWNSFATSLWKTAWWWTAISSRAAGPEPPRNSRSSASHSWAAANCPRKSASRSWRASRFCILFA